jgi:hypothetical protein
MHRSALREGQKTKPSKENKTMEETNRAALFPLGQIVATPAALAALAKAGQTPLDFLTRHVCGGRGELDERYIKAFDPAVLAAMKTLEATLDDFHKCSATVQEVN